MPDEKSSESPNKEFLTTLAKGLSVIRAFGDQQKSITVSEAAALTNVSRATARRILFTLHELGYVKQDGRDFSLTANTLELGFKFLSTQSWIERAGELLKGLSEATEESCSASILQEDEIVYVAHVPSSRLLSIDESVGTRLPALHTSMGRIQMGFLDDDELWRRLNKAKFVPYTPVTITDLRGLFERIQADHAQGFSIVDGELEKGLRTIAVPVIDRNGQVIAAINLSASTRRITRDHMRNKFSPQLKEIAEQITLSGFGNIS